MIDATQALAAINRLPAVSFLWPGMLWLMALLLVLAAAYVWLDRRRRRTAVAYPALRTVGLATPGRAGWRRHVAPLLILVALAALTFAIARPQAVLTLPSRLDTVVLVVDLSGSMRARDVAPTRIRAAQLAARSLVDAQPAGVKVAIVAMAGTAAVAQPPTRSKEEATAAIERLQPQGGTALGNGMLVALTTLLPQAAGDAQRLMNDEEPSRKGQGAGVSPDADTEAVAPGSYAPGAIVLFSDGESNAGPTTLQAAQLAAAHGVRVYTVGVGTPEGVVLSVDGWSARVKLDEAVLKQVADATGAEYFRIEDASGMKKVYRTLGTRLAFDKRDQVEITAFFAAFGALLAACAGMLSLWWFGRVM
ncbi:VWA domain-containing protein [Cupriavidus agavae]|uniref:Ca-activated chloride channel family protein n=1 Tax=Cupriavidus agavae TaxID=1001822 RepID=A0A4Q7RDZ2_9BURK|nr:VWA domain-containing protein [Cupriavidus agavae]RZT31385.1 Ca-activated chloride channel family protein [Cupriavidus agavae]